MFFAWDAPLDDAVRRACHGYYRERYGLKIEDTARIRGLVGLLQARRPACRAACTPWWSNAPSRSPNQDRALLRGDHVPRHLGRTPAALPDRRGMAGAVS
jgi:hypothetical protein